MQAAGGDVLGVDWRVDLDTVWSRLGGDVAIQGNLDPTALFAPLPAIARAVRELVRAGRKARGHVLNLGHGVLPSTPIEAVATFVRTAQESA